MTIKGNVSRPGPNAASNVFDDEVDCNDDAKNDYGHVYDDDVTAFQLRANKFIQMTTTAAYA